MAFTNFRKETSERSDAANWAKQSLIRNTAYHFDSIEGCNENDQNVATHFMERARVDYDGVDNMSLEDIRQAIIQLETIDVLQRKINFANAFGRSLTYILYNNETGYVWMYEFYDIITLKLITTFPSFVAFSQWIQTIKGWISRKKFREISDLPEFDIALRKAGTAWPTNIDCFISNSNNQPVAILEFQNAKLTSVKDHCNNEYFLCKQQYYNKYGHIDYHDDIRRWQSQEILRIQSGLRLFIVTWAQNSPDFALKEVEIIVFPLLPYSKDWTKFNQYRTDMHNFASTKRSEFGRKIAQTYQSYHLEYNPPTMNMIEHNPPLSKQNKTFPFIYYKYKQVILGNGQELPSLFQELIEQG